MSFEPTTRADLEIVAGWITDEDACRMWAGPRVRYPFTVDSLCEDIAYESGLMLSLFDQGGALQALGQILEMSSSRLHLARIIVRPELRGRGLGESICTKLIQAGFREFGVKTTTLNVYFSNTGARRLYERLGFELTPDSVRETAQENWVRMSLFPSGPPEPGVGTA